MDKSQSPALVMRVRNIFAVAMLLALTASCNPFAPKLEASSSSLQFGDPQTIGGYFQAFAYAYEFKDTTLYGTLIAPDFIFSFLDYNLGVNVQWGRDEEMSRTAGLFQGAQVLDLLWGDIIDSSGTQTSFNVTRTFSLDVTFNPGDIEHADGQAVFKLERAKASDPWIAGFWQDESNY
jgi:hypothetical protein